jgi:hypothetical protein
MKDEQQRDEEPIEDLDAPPSAQNDVVGGAIDAFLDFTRGNSNYEDEPGVQQTPKKP